jgi:hypothetical protein
MSAPRVGGVVLYRVSGWGGEKWFYSLAEVKIELLDRVRQGATGVMQAHCITLTSRLTPKALMVALLNRERRAFASVVEVTK